MDITYWADIVGKPFLLFSFIYNFFKVHFSLSGPIVVYIETCSLVVSGVLSFLLGFFVAVIAMLIANAPTILILFLIVSIIWVVNYIWGMVRTGVNETVVPGINGVTGFLVNDIWNKFVGFIKKFVRRSPFDYVENTEIKEGIPTLFSIVKKAMVPLVEKILSPIRADHDD